MMGKQGIRRIQEDILWTNNLGSIDEFVPLDDAYTCSRLTQETIGMGLGKG